MMRKQDRAHDFLESFSLENGQILKCSDFIVEAAFCLHPD